MSEKTQHGPVGRMMVENTDLRVKIAVLEQKLENVTVERDAWHSVFKTTQLTHAAEEMSKLRDENQKLKEEIEKLRSLLLQGSGTLEDIRR